jgi:shikimate kinase
VRPSRHVCLVGLSGTGKSSVAPLLAAILGLGAVDIDDAVARSAGLSVSELFDREGEQRFRELELDALGSALAGPDSVIATGGGVVTTPAATELLEERATVAWLRARPDVLLARLAAHDEDRPLLSGDAAGRLASMAAERAPLYAAVADLVVDVDDLDPSEVAEHIAARLGAS